MKKVLTGLLLLLIVSAFTACTTQNNADSETAQGTDNGMVTEQPETIPTEDATGETDNATTTPETTDAASTDEQAIYLGTWVIEKAYDTGTVSTLSADDISSLIGKEITYAMDSVTSDSSSSETVFYKEITYTKEDFLTNNRTSLSAVGITADTVTGVELYTDEAFAAIWYGLGNVFYITDDDTMVLSYEGTYFELQRAE